MSTTKISLDVANEEEAADLILALNEGRFRAETTPRGTFLWITVGDENKNTNDSVGEPVTIDKLKEMGERLGVTLTKNKRRYTKREDWNDPTKSRQDEVNRDDIRYQTRISKEASKKVEAFLLASGMTKKRLTEEAILSYIESMEPK